MKKFSFILIFCFLLDTLRPVMAADAIGFGAVLLPKPGTMVSMSPSFEAPTLRGIKVHAQDPLRFEFVLDQGDSKFPTAALKDESTKLVKYFLASVTTPAGDLWVNLSPYEKDRIVAQSFGQTEMGRDLLAQDYILKQLTASIIYPESKTGKEFWSRVYAQAAKRFGTTRVPINTFNKVWIVPQAADVYENAANGTAYVSHASLKVLLEGDYLALNKAQKPQGRADSQKLGTDIVREVVIPLLTKEVNEGRNFAPIRQVYHALILATWYKKKLKDSVISLGYADKNKTAGIDFNDDQTKEKIYLQYLEAFKAGAYNYIKEESDPLTKKMIPRKYFSGGASFAMVAREMRVKPDSAMTTAQLAAIGRRTMSLVQVVLNNIGSIPLNGKMDRIRSIKKMDVLKAAATGAAVLALAATQTGDTPIKASLPEYVSMTSTDARLVSEIHKLVYGTGDAKERTLKLLQLVYRDETREAIIRVRESLRKAYAALGKDPNAVVVTANFDAQDITPKPFDLKTAEEERRVLEAKLGTLLKTPGLAIDQQSKDGVLELRLLMLSLESLLATVEPKDLFKMYDDLTATKPYPLVGRSAVKIKIDRGDTPEKMAATVLEGVKPLNGTPVIYLVRPDIAASIAKALPSTSQRVEIAGARQKKLVVLGMETGYALKYRPDILPIATAQKLPANIKDLLLKKVGAAELDTRSYERYITEIYKQILLNPDIQSFGIVYPPESSREIKDGETFRKVAEARWRRLEAIVNLIFASPQGKNYGDKEELLRQETLKMVRYTIMDPLEVVAMKFPEVIAGKNVFSIVAPPADDYKWLFQEMDQNITALTGLLFKGVVLSEDIEFLSYLRYITTEQEFVVKEPQLKASVEAFATKIRNRPKFEAQEKEGAITIIKRRLELFRESLRMEKARGKKLQGIVASIAKEHNGLMIFTTGSMPDGFDEKIGENDVVKEYLVQDRAMNSVFLFKADRGKEASSYGGIDLNAVDLNIKNVGQNIRFNFSTEILENTRNAAGLTPVVINILPLSNLKDFLQR